MPSRLQVLHEAYMQHRDKSALAMLGLGHGLYLRTKHHRHVKYLVLLETCV